MRNVTVMRGEDTPAVSNQHRMISHNIVITQTAQITILVFAYILYTFYLLISV